MKPKNCFFYFLLLKSNLKIYFEPKEQKIPKKKTNFFFGQNHCKVVGSSIPEIIKIQPFHHKLWKFFFLKPFVTISRHNPFFVMKMTNHHNKQLISLESWDQDGFFEPGFGKYQVHIIGLEFLQHSGHQIRVNTWTGSYAPSPWTFVWGLSLALRSHNQFQASNWSLANWACGSSLLQA